MGVDSRTGDLGPSDCCVTVLAVRIVQAHGGEDKTWTTLSFSSTNTNHPLQLDTRHALLHHYQHHRSHHHERASNPRDRPADLGEHVAEMRCRAHRSHPSSSDVLRKEFGLVIFASFPVSSPLWACIKRTREDQVLNFNWHLVD